MKKLLLTIPALGLYMSAQAQNVGIGTTTPDASAMLEVRATNKGVLIPRLPLTSITDATTIPSPATGLQVFNTNAAIASGTGIYVNTGTPVAPMWAKMPTVYTNTPAASGQSLIWNGSTYAPAYGSVTVNGGNLSGTGTPSNPIAFNGITTNSSVFSGNGTPGAPLNINTGAPVYNANQIASSAVSNTAPTADQVLIWNSATNQYVPGVVNAVQIQGDNVSVTNPTNGQTLIFNSTTNQWEPKNIPGDNWGAQSIVNAGGSVLTGNGTTGSPLNVNTAAPVYNANKIVNSSVSSTAPTANQVLVWNATTNQYEPSPVNAVQIQNRNISVTAPANNQTLIFNATTNQWEPKNVPGDNWGTQAAATAAGGVLTGNGLTGTPLTVNVNSPVYNANKINSITVNGTPTTGQVLVYNGTTYSPSVVNAVQIQGDNISTTNPTGGQTLIFNSTTNQWEPTAVPGDDWGGQSVNTVSGSVLTGNGTASSPLGVNTGSPVYNANKINNITVNGTPANGQVLVYNTTSNTYAPANVLVTASNGLTATGNEVKFGGPLTGNTTITTASGKTLAIGGSANTTTFDATGRVGIGTTAPSNALHVKTTSGDPVKIEGLQNGFGTLLAVDANGVIKKIDGGVSFNYAVSSTSGFYRTNNQQTGATPYNMGSSATGSIQPGGYSWTPIGGLSKTFQISNASNSVGFTTEGVVEYDGTLPSDGWVSYAIAIFVDGNLHAVRQFTMTGTGGVDQFDTYKVSGQIDDLSVGSHTISVYGTRRNSPYNSSQELYFCAPAPNYPNTNAFMNRGVLFINGSY